MGPVRPHCAEIVLRVCARFDRPKSDADGCTEIQIDRHIDRGTDIKTNKIDCTPNGVPPEPQFGGIKLIK